MKHLNDEKCAQCGNPTSIRARFCESYGAPLVREDTPTPQAGRSCSAPEGHYGQTVGKMAVKIKVVKEADGSPIDYGEAAVRMILRVIDGLFVYLVGAILIWSSDEKQRLGDRVAHTVVVKV